MRSALIALRVFAAFVLVGLWTGGAFAQSDPSLYNGQVPTAAQWNSYFAAKVDYPVQCVTGSFYGNFSGITAPLACTPSTSITGVASALRLNTCRTISISGDFLWTSPCFDGTANVSASGALNTTGVTAATYGDATHVPAFTVDAKGRIISVTNTAITSGAGSVTSVTCNAGLTGGTFTVTGTCTLDLTRANTWTGLQSLSAGAVITPEATPATNEAGYLGAPENVQNASYSLVMADAGKLLYHTNASAHTYTIPANASVAYPIGTTIVIANEHGAGALTIALTSDTLRWTTLTGSRTLAADGTASLLKVDSTTWRLTGDGIS